MLRSLKLVAYVAVGLTLTVGAARADDWLQTSHDARNTFASTDRLKLPLTEIWSTAGSGPCAVARGRVYSIVTDRSMPVSTLVCTAARTGLVLWKQPLWCRTDLSYFGYDLFAPNVSEDGVVYLMDARSTGKEWVPAIRAFNAVTGQPVGGYAPPPVTPIMPTPLYALDQLTPLPPPETTSTVNFLNAAGGMAPIKASKLLLDGGQLFSSLAFWHLCSWSLRSPAQYVLFRHPEQQVDVAQGKIDTHTRVGILYPSYVSSGNGGTILSGYWDRHMPGSQYDSHPDFILRMDGAHVRWHRDFPGFVMSPGVDNNQVFAILSGQQITALNAGDGSVHWMYPPPGVRPPGGGSSIVGIEPRGYINTDAMVLADRKVFAFAMGLGLVALDQGTGQPLWSARPGATPLAASRDHVFVRAMFGKGTTLLDQVVALRLADGKPEWTQNIPTATLGAGVRRLALSSGQLYVQGEGGLTAFAPAERTFRLAIDGNRKELYRPEEDAAASAPAPEAAPRQTEAAADATVVRVSWNEPLAESSRKLAERRKVAPGLPLLLELEWLDPLRAAVLGAPAGKPAELPARAAFLARCRALAAEFQPDHLDLAPEVNVYLARHPEQVDAVRELLDAAAKEVHAASGKTRVLLSLNCEVLYGRYGQGTTAPFGKLELAGRQDLAPLKTLLGVVDELGLASCPQSGFASPLEMPRDYFPAVRQALDSKRTVVTDLRVEPRQNTPAGQVEAAFLKHLTQNCYWLDAALVACPDLPLSPPAPEPAGKPAAQPLHPGIAGVTLVDVWRDVLRWERVERLTLSPNLAAPAGAAVPAQ